MADILSTDPATGGERGRHPVSDVDAGVARAGESGAEGAARPLANRVETLRRFANVVRSKHEAFADTIARETGKPMWEARSEVDTVIAKVDIRSEEHTSELQSLMRNSYAVCCLKQQTNPPNTRRPSNGERQQAGAHCLSRC